MKKMIGALLGLHFVFSLGWAYEWEGAVSYEGTDFSSGRVSWQSINSWVRRKFTYGSVALEGIRAERFSLWDEALALETYADLWNHAYGNFRVQVTEDADILPRLSYLGEIFQGLGKGWEVSGNFRHMDFRLDQVDLYGFSFGRYIGAWYIRARTTFSKGPEDWLVSNAGYARWYFETEDDFIEVGGGVGEAERLLFIGGLSEGVETQFYLLRIQKFLNPHLGLFLAASYQDEEKLPVGRIVTLGLLVRW